MTSACLPRGVPGLAVFALVAALSVAACGGDGKPSKQQTPDAATTAQYQAYVSQITPALNTLGQQIPRLDTSGNADPAAFAAALRTYDDALNAFAAALDKIDAPGQAKAPHENFSKQSKAIASAFDKVQQRISSPSHTATKEELTLSIDTPSAVVQWVAACARLQDLARTKGATPGADFKCATTLSIGSTGTGG